MQCSGIRVHNLMSETGKHSAAPSSWLIEGRPPLVLPHVREQQAAKGKVLRSLNPSVRLWGREHRLGNRELRFSLWVILHTRAWGVLKRRSRLLSAMTAWRPVQGFNTHLKAEWRAAYGCLLRRVWHRVVTVVLKAPSVKVREVESELEKPQVNMCLRYTRANMGVGVWLQMHRYRARKQDAVVLQIRGGSHKQMQADRTGAGEEGGRVGLLLQTYLRGEQRYKAVQVVVVVVMDGIQLFLVLLQLQLSHWQLPPVNTPLPTATRSLQSHKEVTRLSAPRT